MHNVTEGTNELDAPQLSLSQHFFVIARRKPVERALSAAREENSEFRLAVGFLHGHFRLAPKGDLSGLVPKHCDLLCVNTE